MTSSGSTSCLGRIARLIGACLVTLAAGVLVTNIVTLATTGEYQVAEESIERNEADAILVLGASVLPDGSPSDVLRDRLDTAARLYFTGAAPRIIASGDDTAAPDYQETAAMKNYLVALGVDADDVLCDHFGVATYESVYRAQSIFGAKRLVIVTQSYHLPRALFSARGLGMDACGVSAASGAYDEQLYYDLREIPARTKDFVRTVLRDPVEYTEGPS